MTYPVLDPCCGSRMMWFDRNDSRCIFGDVRDEHITGFLQHNKPASVHISPDVQLDFRNLPFPDESFYHVVFDPPHLTRVGDCWIRAKYGRLGFGWREDLRQGFRECFRVLKPFGTLVFKWSETNVKIADVLSLSPVAPLYGNRNHQKSKTHWIVYIKPERMISNIPILEDSA